MSKLVVKVAGMAFSSVSVVTNASAPPQSENKIIFIELTTTGKMKEKASCGRMKKYYHRRLCYS